jgi:hypothetical protein
MLKAPIIASRTTHVDSPALADTREEAEVHVVNCLQELSEYELSPVCAPYIADGQEQPRWTIRNIHSF